jgi:hypothetical protein
MWSVVLLPHLFQIASTAEVIYHTLYKGKISNVHVQGDYKVCNMIPMFITNSVIL